MPNTILPPDPRLDFLDSISLETSHVFFDPPLILLFGGDTTQTYGSFRERLNHFTSNKPRLSESVRYPESFSDWLHGSMYSDLLEFEFDLACLSTYVVIILETAGSIAELGSFAVKPEFLDKVIVVVEDEHFDSSSFIDYGPLRKFDKANILVVPVNFLRPNPVPLLLSTSTQYESDESYMSDPEYVDSLNIVIEHLESLISQKDKSTKGFIQDDIGHLSFLVYELVNMFLALKPKEIREYLERLGIKINNTRVKIILYLLLKLELLVLKRVGNEDYYFCRSPDKSRFKFSSKSVDSKFDRTVVSINTSHFYSLSPSEKRRFRLIKKHMVVTR